MQSIPFFIKTAQSPSDFELARALFREYAESLEIDLCFQNFDRELQTMEQQYAAPSGALFLAISGDMPAGCTAVRQFEGSTAELKRMYVKPEFRGNGVSKQLLEKALEAAKGLGYATVRLDTLPSMREALGLYYSFGFTDIAAYRFNPVPGSVYLEKELW